MKAATALIVKGSIMCCAQINSPKFSQFFKKATNKKDIDQIKNELDTVYRDLHIKMLSNTNQKLDGLSRHSGATLPTGRQEPETQEKNQPWQWTGPKVMLEMTRRLRSRRQQRGPRKRNKQSEIHAQEGQHSNPATSFQQGTLLSTAIECFLRPRQLEFLLHKLESTQVLGMSKIFPI